ncbi:amylo-alpha-1,6-glucosidase [Ruegeria sp. THAF33]|uniref:amylo-alpha-1,6-glucosidase n=1 Tax=Ruegeria sp. THAF33 TaxID=2587853 RepID=UPI001267B296|nr:trehalase family glycosidase [Ruegeria sp. THAF33]QFT74507.1 Glucosidase YgjK precursor [Ruegeria sp. THAF33]
MSQALIDQACKVMEGNDRGSYTVPTHGLYPFQWNWDSALSALGFSHFDMDRAWVEVETLMAHQWEDGMVPHIVFHEPDDGYFPGPDVWQTGQSVPTTGITQPAVAGLALRKLYNRAEDKAAARTRLAELLPKVHAWHQWFYRNRDPENTGLVAIIHPWESGRDNSVDWDEGLDAVPTEGIAPFTRRDTTHANPDHRPTDDQYQRYIWLVEHFRGLRWDNTKLHDASPFRLVDPGFNAILIRSCDDVAELAEILGIPAMASEAREMATKGREALESLWNANLGQYTCYNRAAGVLQDTPTVGGLLAAIAQVPPERAEALVRRIALLSERCDYLVPSHDPADDAFDSKRYWRGPTWLVVNYMIAEGLIQSGQEAMAQRILAGSLRLIEKSGFAEYYDPISGEPCGGGDFTWTAAMVIEILKIQKVPA